MLCEVIWNGPCAGHTVWEPCVGIWENLRSRTVVEIRFLPWNRWDLSFLSWQGGQLTFHRNYETEEPTSFTSNFTEINPLRVFTLTGIRISILFFFLYTSFFSPISSPQNSGFRALRGCDLNLPYSVRASELAAFMRSYFCPVPCTWQISRSFLSRWTFSGGYLKSLQVFFFSCLPFIAFMHCRLSSCVFHVHFSLTPGRHSSIYYILF